MYRESEESEGEKFDSSKKIKIITTNKEYPKNPELRKALQAVGYKNGEVRNLKREELIPLYEESIH